MIKWLKSERIFSQYLRKLNTVCGSGRVLTEEKCGRRSEEVNVR